MAKNILLGITSSIAAYKAYELIRLFIKNGDNVKVVLTPNALNFVSPLVLKTLSQNEVYYEQFDPRYDTEHISLCEWADVFLIAPISANTISKCALGIADNLLLSVFCAYLGSKKPVVMAPAMNSDMWENKIIQKNIGILKNEGVNFTNPEAGFLACGTEGRGRLSNLDIIFENTQRALYQNKKNNDKKILVTLGGTKENIDNVRIITNLSSGKMGSALCAWAYRLGYDVCAISTVELKNKPYRVIETDSAQNMLNKLQNQDFDYLIMASAVSDFRVKNKSENKISKEDVETLTLELIKNPDVVAQIAKNKNENQKIIGFCLGDNDLINCAKAKLKNKNLDYIVANSVNTSLNKDTNEVTIIDKNGKIEDIKTDTKMNIARKILEVTCD